MPEAQTQSSSTIPAAIWAKFLIFAGALALVAGFAWLSIFDHFRDYDDEGWLMFTVRQMLNGKTLYRQMRSAYGPVYYFSRWIIHGLLQVPLDNDSVRLISWATFVLAAFLVGLIGWKLGGWLVAFTGTVVAANWLAALGNEPGHPQEAHILVYLLAMLAAAHWARRAAPRFDSMVWFLLGASVSAIILVKINVGAFYALALAVSVAGWSTRNWLSRLICAAFSLTALLLPWALMRHRLDGNWSAFAEMNNLAALPLCIAVAALPPVSGGRRRDWACLVLGGCLGAMVPLAFAIHQGNTFADLVNALVIVPQQVALHGGWGWTKPMDAWVRVWALLSACLGATMVVGSALAARFPSGAMARLTGAVMPWIRLLTAGFFTPLSLISGDHLDFVRLQACVSLAWLALIPPRGDGISAGRGRFLRYFVAWTVCLMPLQIYPVPGSQIRMGTLPVSILIMVVFADVLTDWRARGVARSDPECHRLQARVDWLRLGELAACMLVPIIAVLPIAVLASLLAMRRGQLVRLDLPGCRLTRVTEDQAAIDRFLAANVAALSDGFLARTGQNSLHWWANVPLLSARAVSDSWSTLDADDDAVLTAAYSGHPKLMFLDRASYIDALAKQPTPDFQVLRFVHEHFRPIARAWEFTLLVRKDRPDSIELTDLRGCAYPPAGNDSASVGITELRLRLPAKSILDGLGEIQLKDYATDTVIADTRIPALNPGSLTVGMVKANSFQRVSLSAVAVTFAREPGTNFQLQLRQPVDLRSLTRPCVRLLDTHGRPIVLLPVVFP